MKVFLSTVLGFSRPFITLALLSSLALSAAEGKKAAKKAAAPPAEKYPLEKYLTALAEPQWQARDTQIAAINTPVEVAARAAHVRREFLDALGGLPEKRTPLNARITGVLEREGYRVEKLVFESQPGFFVTANIYVPTTGKGPFPAILGASGHSIEGKAYPVYQTAFIGLALNGNIVLAFDPPGQGERFEGTEPNGQMKLLGHFSPGLQCILTGGNIVRYFMWDAMRAVDYLLTRADVDPKRIGAAGNSGGGTQSAFLAVMEPRLAASAPSCYWTSNRALWAKAGPQDPEQVLHQTIKRGIDYSDVLVAFAPKPIIMLTATKDSFPILGARATHEEGKPIYAALGAADRLGYFEYNDGHGWSQPRREATYAWFNQWFHGRPGPVSEPKDIKTETIEALQSTATGQVVTALNGKTMQMLSLETADRLYTQRKLAKVSDPKKARDIIKARLEMSRPRTAPNATSVEQSTHGAYMMETINIIPEEGITLKTDVFFPKDNLGVPRPVVIIAVENEAPLAPEWDTELATWIEAGYIVAVTRLRGLLPPDKPTDTGYTLRYRIAMRAVIVGKTLAGMRVEDLLAVYDYMAVRPNVKKSDISVIGRGIMGMTALYAGALEPGLKKIVAERTPLSFRDFARAKAVHPSLAEIVVPGVFFDFDLPDIARLGGEGKVVLVNPVSLANPETSVATARSEYGRRVKVLAGLQKVSPRELQ